MNKETKKIDKLNTYQNEDKPIQNTSLTVKDIQLTNSQNNKQIIYPMIDDLVETLHNDTLNNLIDTKCITELDKKTFMIFVITYFYTYLNVGKDVSKEDIKIFLTELIRNPEKRRQCIELYHKQLELLNM
jgi:hypothetical protein